jgi:hypothetical protein
VNLTLIRPVLVNPIITYLFVIQAAGESEHPCLGVEREDVVGPVADHRVGQVGVGVQVGIGGLDLTHSGTTRGVLRDVEGIGALQERRRVVVGICDLKRTRGA